MRKEIQALIIIVVVVIGAISVAGYMYYTEMQHKNEELNQMLKDVKGELEDVKNQQNNTTEESSTSKSSGSSVKYSSSGKVTYEEAGVDKNIGYMKTCKYKGCGKVYNSRLSHCPRCGQRNIYI